MAVNIPLIASGLSFIAFAESPLPTELGSFERIVSYIGLLVMGWFFWKRESGRADKTVEELRAEIAVLKKENKELEKDIRDLLKNRTRNPNKKRHDRFNYSNPEDENDN